MYSIPYVKKTETGEQLDSHEILPSINLTPEGKSDVRTEVLARIKNGRPIYLCGFCKQPVLLCGGKDSGEVGKSFREVHFKHYNHSPECKFYLKTKYDKAEIERMKFHGLKEGPLHQAIKLEIARALIEEGYDVRIEEVVSLFALYKDGTDSENYKRIWRRPDVRARNQERQFVIEIQLATTFLSVILERMEFYKESKHYVLWVLDHFNPEEKQKFTTMDILSLTNRNIFEFNDEMRKESIKRGKLVLRCYFETPILQDNLTFNYTWNSKTVYIDDLIFDDEHYIAYYYDCWSREKELKDESNRNNENSNAQKDLLFLLEDDCCELPNSEEEFRMMLRELNLILYNESPYFQSLFKAIYEKNFNLAVYYINEVQKNNLKMPQLSNTFLKLAIQVAGEYEEYREIINNLLCYKGFDYDIEKVFGSGCGYFVAWKLVNSVTSLRSYLVFFTQNGYSIPKSMIESFCKDLFELKNNTMDKLLSENERDQIEKKLLVIMWNKLQKKQMYKFLDMLGNNKVLSFVIRLASYPLGKPLGCAHPNLAALSGTMKEYHAPFAHLTVDMIKACRLDNDNKIRRNYVGLQKIAKTNQDLSCDELVYTLFKVFGR